MRDDQFVRLEFVFMGRASDVADKVMLPTYDDFPDRR
jgi:hypothetical protein